MHVDQHGIERQSGLDAGHDLVAKALIDRAHRGARGCGEGRQPLDDGPAARLGRFAPDMQGRGKIGRLVLRGIAAPHAVLLVGAPAGGKGHELVGLGAESRNEDTLGQGYSR
jgi:hypothetical protein